MSDLSNTGKGSGGTGFSFTGLIVALQNIIRALNNIAETIGANILTGNNTWSGTNTFTGATSLDGTNAFGGAASFNALAAIEHGLDLATRVVTVAGAVTVTAADIAVVINKGTGAATAVNLFAAPALGSYLIVKDGKGDAATNHITITPAAGTIDGASTLVISTNYGVARLIYNGTEWNSV